MPVMKGTNSAIAAGTFIANVLSGEDFEFLPGAALISLYASASQAGVLLTFKADNEALGSNLETNIAAASGRILDAEDALLDQEPVAAGSRLSLRVENTAGTASTANWKVKVELIPQGMLG